MMRRWSTRVALVLVASMAGATGASGQGTYPGPEGRLMRQAATLESAGDLDGAEAALRELLEMSPASSGALFALERVLRAKGDVSPMLPLVDAFLARRPDDGVRSLQLDLLARLGSFEALEREADAWIASEPRSQRTYFEVARAYEVAYGPVRAMEVLRRGRAVLGERAFALEMGDLAAAALDENTALAEWALAVGPDGSGREDVARRLASMPEGFSSARRFVGILAQADEVGRRAAAAMISLNLGLPGTLPLAQAVVADLAGAEKEAFLSEVTARSRGAGQRELATWATRELRAMEEAPRDRRVGLQQQIESHLVAGDTAAAAAAQRELVGTFAESSEGRRRAEARAIGLEASFDSPEELARALETFRGAYPDAPETDSLAAVVSSRLAEHGNASGAARVLEGAQGPHSTLERAFQALEEGQVEQGRELLFAAVGGLPPAEATPVIQLGGLLARLSPGGAALLARAGSLAHRGDPAAAARLVVAGRIGLPAEEAAPLLAEAARMADRAEAVELSVGIRESLVRDYPGSLETGEATLYLARHYATSGDSEAAVRILEDLIVDRPGAAVVPEARRELERLRGGRAR